MTPADFRAIRVRLGMTGTEFAAALGMSARNGKQVISQIETGRRAIRNELAAHVLLLEKEMTR